MTFQIQTENSLAKALEALGLTRWQIATLVKMGRGNRYTAEQLSQAANVPYPRMYGVLKDLEKLGWVDHEATGRPTLWFKKTWVEIKRTLINGQVQKVYEVEKEIERTSFA